MIDTQCPICSGNKFRFIRKQFDRFYHKSGSFDWYMCLTCALYFVFPLLNDKVMSAYYPEDYYSYENAGHGENKTRKKQNKFFYYLLHPFKALNAIVYSKILKQNADIVLAPGSRVLDVGCGDGSYLSQKKLQGARCFGVDISSQALQKLKNNDASAVTFCGNVWRAGFEQGSFDLIHLSHVLEHIAAIDQAVSEIHKLLAPNGIAVVQVPNTASATRMLFGQFWIHWDTPRHVYAFSKKNLTSYFKKHGLVLHSSRTIENSFSVLGSLIYCINGAKRNKIRLDQSKAWWDNEILKFVLFPYCLFVNLLCVGDTVEFILKKSPEPS